MGEGVMTASAAAQPLYFGPASRPLCGWYHPPHGRPAAIGLVLCTSIGREDLNVHRTLRFLADAAARQGVAALRFDYDGCGDSAGDDFDPQRVQAWTSSVDAAIDELKRRAGVQRLCLFGVRLGALLAALAAQHRDDIASLIALAPVVSGRSFVREWKTLGRVRGWTNGADSAAPDDRNDDISEAAGFAMTQATCEELSRIDLTALPRPAPEVLLIDRDDLPRRDRWAAHLQASGVQLTHEVLPGYLAMMSEPHSTQVPQAVVARVLAWLGRSPVGEATRSATQPFDGVYASARIGDVRETPVLIEEGDGAQFAVLSEPDAGGAPPARALIIINSGACRHIGPNRMYVQLARQVAARGWRVLRVDVSGLGDSEPHQGEPPNSPYTSLAQRDIALWIDFLRDRGVAECHLLGICSGAYHGFKAAAAGSPLASVLAINPLVFFWHDGMPLDPPLADYRVVRLATLYKRSALDVAKWRKLLSGQVNVAQLAAVMGRRVLARAKNAARAAARGMGWPLRDDLVAELRRLERQATRIDFIFSDADPGFGVLREQAAAQVDRMTRQGRISMRMLAQTDHTFSTLAARRELFAQVEACLGRATASSTAEVGRASGRTMASV
jgi:pimeloyl-ACP methyl ester carboxylesterase